MWPSRERSRNSGGKRQLWKTCCRVLPWHYTRMPLRDMRYKSPYYHLGKESARHTIGPLQILIQRSVEWSRVLTSTGNCEVRQVFIISICKFSVVETVEMLLMFNTSVHLKYLLLLVVVVVCVYLWRFDNNFPGINFLLPWDFPGIEHGPLGLCAKHILPAE